MWLRIVEVSYTSRAAHGSHASDGNRITERRWEPPPTPARPSRGAHPHRARAADTARGALPSGRPGSAASLGHGALTPFTAPLPTPTAPLQQVGPGGARFVQVTQ